MPETDPNNNDFVKYISASERAKPSTRFAGPNNSFPIRPGHSEDVRNAWDLAGHAENPDGIRKTIRRIAKELGMSDALPKTAETSKSLNFGDTLVLYGAEVKDLGNGKVGGYLVRFGDAKNTDLTGEFFTAQTDFGLDLTTKARVIFDHGFDATLKRRKLTAGEMKADEVGIWIEGVLEQRDEYEKAIARMVTAKKLGWSSGSSAHLIERELVDGAIWIKSWPIIEASLTPSPCEPRAAAIPLKSWVAKRVTDGGLGYDDSYRDGWAARAAVNALADSLMSCVSNCFGNYSDIPRIERMAQIRAEFTDFTDDSIAVIDALLDDDDPDSATTKSFFMHRSGLASAPLISPDSVVSALKGYSDLTSRLAGTRERAGRKLNASKLASLKSAIDGVSPIVAELQAILAAHSPAQQVDVKSAAAKLRLLALKHKHRQGA